ncbi:MAG: hypothetical protein QGI38_05355, partial [Candidatus Woesearchaeota archaeon]|nr:hypothetical protein [Candidatus Woesearchaeota archaeon]
MNPKNKKAQQFGSMLLIIALITSVFAVGMYTGDGGNKITGATGIESDDDVNKMAAFKQTIEGLEDRIKKKGYRMEDESSSKVIKKNFFDSDGKHAGVIYTTKRGEKLQVDLLFMGDKRIRDVTSSIDNQHIDNWIMAYLPNPGELNIEDEKND